MAGLKDVLRSIGDAVLPLEKKPTYRSWMKNLKKQPESSPIDVLYRGSEAQLRLVGGVTERETMKLAVKGKGAEKYASQGIDAATLKLIKPIEQVIEPKR